MLKHVLEQILLPTLVSYIVTMISFRHNEKGKHEIQLKFDLYLDFINTLGNIFIHNDEDRSVELQKKLLELFNAISLIGSENVTNELIRLRSVIIKESKHKDFGIKLETQMAELKNAMRKDLSLPQFKDLHNGFSFYAMLPKDKESNNQKLSLVIDKIFNIDSGGVN
jgi:hypothetical protein